MKKYAAGITEKRLKNRRFRKTEDAILRVFFEEDIYVGIKEMAAKAGVARSTFYHHHKTAREIIPDYRRYILRRYSRMISGAIRINGMKTRVIYTKTLIFIMQNQREFEVLLRSGNMDVMKEMIMGVEGWLVKQMRIPNGARKVFAVYASEVTELINEWCRRGFRKDEMNRVLDDIMYLTDTARIRLGPIA